MPLLKLIIPSLFVFFAAAAGQQNVKDICESTHPFAKFYKGFCFIVGAKKYKWEEAKSSCTVFPNGHLAITSSPNVADFIAGNTLFPQGINYSWVGLKESEDTLGKWYWHHKTPSGLRTSTLSTTHNTTSSKKCVTIGVASPRLQEFDCNEMKHFVCQYSIGDRDFVSVNSLRGKKAKYSSPDLSFTVDKEIKCIQIAGQMPTSSLAYNSVTQSCEVYMEFPDELELEDAPGFEMTTQVGEESEYISCKKDKLNSFLIPNSTFDIDRNADFVLESRITLKCLSGTYMTKENTADNLWYTTFSPPQLTCENGKLIPTEKTNLYKCLAVPETIPMYCNYYDAPSYTHYYTTSLIQFNTLLGTGWTNCGIVFRTTPATSYCPEKKPIYRHWQQFADLRQHYAYRLQNPLQSYTNQGIDSYCVKKLGECGADKPIVIHFHSGKFDEVLKVAPEPVTTYTQGGTLCYAW